MKPATYSIRASLPGLRLSRESTGVTATVEARSCAVVNLALSKDWPSAIEGHVVSPDGRPASSGIGVALIWLQEEGDATGLPEADTKTDGNGEYSFQAVPPGRYKIATNLYGPTSDVPYPEMYWPAASTEAAGSPFEVTPGVVLRRDFRLAPRVGTTVVEGTVVRPDGKPAEGARVEILRSSDYAVTGQMPTADATGHFSFVALDGYGYALIATQGGKDSEGLFFSLDKGSQVIKLVLDYPSVVDRQR